MTKENDLSVFAALYKAAYTLNNDKIFGQKKTIKKLFTIIKDYLNTRAVVNGANIKVNSLFFDASNSVLILYSIIQGNTECAIRVNAAQDSSAFTVDMPEKYTGIARKLASWLAFRLESGLNTWQQIAIYTRALKNMPAYKEQVSKLATIDKRRIADSKRCADSRYGSNPEYWLRPDSEYWISKY